MIDPKIIIFEQGLAPFERFLLLAILEEPNLLHSTQQQMANRLGCHFRHIVPAMNRLKAMNCFRRSLETRNLILNDPNEWRVLSRK